jgi:heme exporter protein D|tara:strand:+ start:238 stop:471 length:234 start_codon:yes stop_codon:yes gene_type:complete
MIMNFISMNGSGLFVWLSFAIVIGACSILYFKTRKTLKKYEKEFAIEIDKLSKVEKQAILKQSKVANQVLASQSKTA